MLSLILPPKSSRGKKNIELTNLTSAVIIGANGSGKSRLGYWIESNTPEEILVHRIAAQRSLELPDYTFPEHYEEAQKTLFYGTTSKRKKKNNPKFGRWGNHPTTTLLYDIDELITLIFAYENKRNYAYIDQVKKGKKNSDLPDSIFDKLKNIWEYLLPHRQIFFDETKIITKSEKGNYPASEMSDGERVIFYLIGQCLCAQENSVIIIDEPELHIHKSLQVPLWDQLEQARSDCLFVYLTHDLNFASSRVLATKIWLKGYDGNHWKWEEINSENILPEEVLFEILGSRRPVIFVEGNKNSIDYRIYQAVFPNHHIIPRDSCSKVIEATKTFRELPQLHHLDVFGLIDLDCRSEDEVNKLETKGIYCLQVAEVENLLCVPGLIKMVSKRLEKDFELVLTNVNDFIIQELKKELEYQVSNKSAFEIYSKLRTFGKDHNRLAKLKSTFQESVDSINIDSIYSGHLKYFKEVIENKDYHRALQIFNRKSLSDRLSSIIGLSKKEYTKFALRILDSDEKEKVIKELQQYLPITEIFRDSEIPNKNIHRSAFALN